MYSYKNYHKSLAKQAAYPFCFIVLDISMYDTSEEYTFRGVEISNKKISGGKSIQPKIFNLPESFFNRLRIFYGSMKF